MRIKRFCLVLVLLGLVSGAAAAGDHYKWAVSPDQEMYFGHISYLEANNLDPVAEVLRGQFEPIKASVNLPLLPGDIIRTTSTGRCEIQFDTGTLIRLDHDTELKIETILAPCLSSRDKVSNMVLHRGRVFVMYRNYNYSEIFQVITPHASFKFKRGSVGTVSAVDAESSSIDMKRYSAFALYGDNAENLKEKRIKKNKSAVITAEHELIVKEADPDPDFLQWNDQINRNFDDLHKGKSIIPKPIKRYSNAVIYFAEKFSSAYGEWLWDDLYGYVWRPGYNDLYKGIWHPYYFGQWRQVDSQLFWVPDEPWGWVPYHLGIWSWDKKWGWYWIPGSIFAPSWTIWTSFDSYYSWRPWGMWDWFYYDSFFTHSSMYQYWRYYIQDPYWNGIWDYRENIPDIKKVVSKKQLAKSEAPPMPGELEKIYNKVMASVKKGDTSIISAMNMPAKGIVVHRDRLIGRRISEAGFTLDNLPDDIRTRMSQVPADRQALYTAVNDLQKNRLLSAYSRGNPLGLINPRIPAGMKNEGISPVYRNRDLPQKHVNPLAPINRFRDWNPDFFVARAAGVSIHYISMKNEIRCPELRLNSRTVSRMNNLASRTGYSYSGGWGGGGSGGGSHSSSGSGSSIDTSRSGGSGVTVERGGGGEKTRK